MRALLSVFVTLLILIAIAGIGAGVAVVILASRAKGSGAGDVILAIVYGSVPFAIGTVALGSVSICMAIDLTGRQQVDAIERRK